MFMTPEKREAALSELRRAGVFSGHTAAQQARHTNVTDVLKDALAEIHPDQWSDVLIEALTAAARDRDVSPSMIEVIGDEIGRAGHMAGRS